MEVEFPDGKRTLCIIPAKFHKKLWIRNGSYLMVEADRDIEAAVSGQVTRVLFDEHVKQLQRMPGVWPEAFQKTERADKDAEEEQRRVDAEGSTDEPSDSDDGLPPLERIDNRRVLEQYEDDSDSDD